MRYEVAKALAVSVIALAAPPAMARPATVATPTPPTDTPTNTDTPTAQPCVADPVEGVVDIRPVPGVVGMTRDNAAAVLADERFKTDANPSDAASDWIVRRQSPSGEAPCGSPVTLYLRPVTPAEGDTTPAVGPETSETGPLSNTELSVLLVAAAAAAAVWGIRRALRGPRLAPAASVVCMPCADPSPGVEVRDLAPTAEVTFVCHHDQGRQEIREIVR